MITIIKLLYKFLLVLVDVCIVFLSNKCVIYIWFLGKHNIPALDIMLIHKRHLLQISFRVDNWASLCISYVQHLMKEGIYGFILTLLTHYNTVWNGAINYNWCTCLTCLILCLFLWRKVTTSKIHERPKYFYFISRVEYGNIWFVFLI